MRWIWIIIIALAGSLTGYLVTRFEANDPLIQTRTSSVYVGDEHLHEFRVGDEGTGVESLRIWLVSGSTTHELFNETYAGSVFLGASLNIQRSVEVSVRPGELGLADGRAVLHVEATDYSWSGNVTRVEIPIIIDTQPPRISLEGGLTYVRRGGTEAVVYRVNEEQAEHHVELGEQVFRGFTHPQDPELRVALYALSPETELGRKPQVVAIDRAGNRTTVTVPIEVIERAFPVDEIALSESFMQAKVIELLGDSEGRDTLEAYLGINREMRAENARQIREICERASAEKLWSGAFLQLPGSRVGARFAERRTYTYGGREVDTQIHQGYDLASTSHAPVPAANDGVVIYADTLGIYGNTVILDHGLGLFSLYGHLAELAVEKGKAVARGEFLGATGTTGLAGGDHLHFAILVGGVFVDPLEFFDARWIREHLDPKLSVGPKSAT